MLKILRALGALLLMTSVAIAGPAISTLTLPSATTAYTAGQMLATTATGTSVVVPSFKIANQGSNGALINALRVSINDTTSTAWGAKTLQIDLWTAAPTFLVGNGDRAAFLPNTGAAAHLRTFTCTLSAVVGDGVYGECAPAVSNFATPSLPSGTNVYWTVVATAGSGVTGASKVVTLTAEQVN